MAPGEHVVATYTTARVVSLDAARVSDIATYECSISGDSVVGGGRVECAVLEAITSAYSSSERSQ